MNGWTRPAQCRIRSERSAASCLGFGSVGLFQPFEQALHEPYRDRLAAPAGLIVGLARFTLPRFHVPNLGRCPRLKILLDDVPADEVELQFALGTLQRSQISQRIVFREKSIGINRSLAAVSGRGHCLSVLEVAHIARGEYSRNASLSLVLGEDVALQVQFELALEY